jgi:hypothetical protein
MRAQNARASPEIPRIQTVIRADSRKADVSKALNKINTCGKAYRI